MHAIDRAQPGTGTDLKIPFERFREVEKGRGLVAVISDFYCDPDALLKSVQPLAYQGQDVILFQLLDPQELKPQLKESALLEDMESGKSMEVSPIYMSSLYRERIAAHVDALNKAARGGLTTASNITEPLDLKGAAISCSGTGARRGHGMPLLASVSPGSARDRPAVVAASARPIT
jgi:hypothetical protein